MSCEHKRTKRGYSRDICLDCGALQWDHMGIWMPRSTDPVPMIEITQERYDELLLKEQLHTELVEKINTAHKETFGENVT